MSEVEPTLRPVTEADLAQLGRLLTEPETLGLDWGGFGDVRALSRRLAGDGLLGPRGMLAIDVAGGCVGQVGWRPVNDWGRDPSVGFGASVFPEHQGRGYGWRAQRLLVDYLFDTTPVHRIQAGTRVDNVAEQRALEKVGLTLEGTVRGVQFKGGAWQDLRLYSVLRGEL